MRQAPEFRRNPGPPLTSAEEDLLDELIGAADLGHLRCAIRDALGIRDRWPASGGLRVRGDLRVLRELLRRAVVSVDGETLLDTSARSEAAYNRTSGRDQAAR